MKVEIQIDAACQEPKVIVQTASMTPQVERLLERLRDEPAQVLTGSRDGRLEVLHPQRILRVYASAGKVYAATERGEFELRMRLYEAERRLEGGAFARISNAEIVNLDRVRAFDLRLTGTIVVRFADGSITYAARRYVAALKKRLGIGGEKK